MGLAAEIVIESDRIASLRPPKADGSEVAILNPRWSMTGRQVESYSLPPDEFHEVGPILRILGVRVTERRPNLWEKIRDLIRPPSRSSTRAVVLASQ